MDRINVFETETDEHGQVIGRLAGWFDRDRAEAVKGRTEWDGETLADVHVGANRWQTLYRTAQGRYVLYSTSAWAKEEDICHYVTADAAREWLVIDGQDEIVERWFGELEEESGPGRPEVGPATQIRLGAALTDRVDAVRQGSESRAAVIRRLLADALDAQG